MEEKQIKYTMQGKFVCTCDDEYMSLGANNRTRQLQKELCDSIFSLLINGTNPVRIRYDDSKTEIKIRLVSYDFVTGTLMLSFAAQAYDRYLDELNDDEVEKQEILLPTGKTLVHRKPLIERSSSIMTYRTVTIKREHDTVHQTEMTINEEGYYVEFVEQYDPLGLLALMLTTSLPVYYCLELYNQLDNAKPLETKYVKDGMVIVNKEWDKRFFSSLK